MKDTKPNYIWAVFLVFLAAVIAITILLILQPDKDNTNTIITIVGLVAPTIGSIIAVLKAQETHLAVNSRLDAFIEESGLVSKAEGYKEGVAHANARTDEINESKVIDTDETVILSDETLVISKEDEEK